MGMNVKDPLQEGFDVIFCLGPLKDSPLIAKKYSPPLEVCLLHLNSLSNMMSLKNRNNCQQHLVFPIIIKEVLSIVGI